MKRIKLIISGIVLLVAVMLSACGGTGESIESDSKPVETDVFGIPLNSILYYNEDSGSAELMKFFEDGNVPEEADILYDQMGSNPNIIISDPEIIRELYNRLGKVTVEGESNMSITDCYHHVQFKLSEDKYIYYSFEGSELWCYKSQNYDITDGGKLFSYMRELTENYEEQELD